jgi:PAS domain S-box-containing protein
MIQPPSARDRLASVVVRYGLAALGVAAATAARLGLDNLFGPKLPYLFFFLAVVVASAVGGLGPSLLTLVLSVFSAAYFLLHPRGSILVGDANDLLGLVLFVGVGGAIVIFGELGRATRRQLEREVADRARAEASLAEQLRLAEYGRDIIRAIKVESTLDAMLSRCAEATVRHLGGAFARIWTLEDDAECLELRASAGLYTHIDGAHSRIPVGQFKIGKIASERAPHLTNGVVGDPRVPEQAWAIREGMVGFAGYPLVVEDRVVGVLAMFARHELSGATLVMMGSVADEIAVGIERRRAEERLDRQSEWLRVTLGSIGDAVIATDTQGRVALLNPVAQSLTGWSETDAKGRPLTDVFRIVNEGTREIVEDPAARALRDGVIVGLANHTVLIARDGSERSIDDSAAPIRSSQGEVIGAVLVFRDVTEARTAERRLEQSEQRFRALIEASAQVVWTTEPDGIVKADSPSWRAFTGQTFDEWKGHGWLDAIYPDDRASAAKAWADAVAGYAPYATHYRVRRHDGVFRWTAARGVPILDAHGAIREWVGMNTDVHDAREAEAALRISEDRLRMAIESANVGTWDWYPPDGPMLWDDRCRALCGLPPDADVSFHDSFLPAIHPDDRDRTMAAVRRALDPAGSGDYDVEYRLIGVTDGVTRWVAARGRAFFREGKPHRFVGTALDITDRKRAADELRIAKEEAEFANEAKSRFLAVLSHELRTPLNPILLAVTALLDRPDEAKELRPNLEMIRQYVNLQSRLIDDLLDVMRIVRGKMPLHWEVADCHRLIEQALQICRSEVYGKRLKLSAEYGAERRHVNADPARLQQVIWNLVKNAVKFTPDGGSIVVRTRNEFDSPEGQRNGRDGRIVIEVIDTGIGIEPDVLPLIFDPFQQGETTITRKFGGLGLGLAICRGVVEAHGGSIAAESAGKNRGTTFRVTLKALPASEVESSAEHPAIGSPRRSESGEPLSILLVEDEPATLRLMARLLRGLGHTITTAATIASAQEAIEVSSFDLIVSDIGLPDGSGLELMRMVVTARGPIPAIALTGYGMEEDIRRSRDAGFTAHLTKPIDFTKLETMIQQIAPSRPRTLSDPHSSVN